MSSLWSRCDKAAGDLDDLLNMDVTVGVLRTSPESTMPGGPFVCLTADQAEDLVAVVRLARKLAGKGVRRSMTTGGYSLPDGTPIGDEDEIRSIQMLWPNLKKDPS